VLGALLVPAPAVHPFQANITKKKDCQRQSFFFGGRPRGGNPPQSASMRKGNRRFPLPSFSQRKPKLFSLYLFCSPVTHRSKVHFAQNPRFRKSRGFFIAASLYRPQALGAPEASLRSILPQKENPLKRSRFKGLVKPEDRIDAYAYLRKYDIKCKLQSTCFLFVPRM